MKNIVIAGRLTKDATTRQAGSGNVTAFSVAVDHGWGDKKTTLFFDCSWFGKRGEAIQHLLTKGREVTAAGDFSTREYNGKTYLEVNITDVKLQGGKRDDAGTSGDGYGSGGRPSNQASSRPDFDDSIPDFDSSEIPF